MVFKKLRQFWVYHLLSAVIMAIFSGIVLYFLGASILEVPRGTIPFLATVLSTLLGLTFTAFAIISAFMPNLRVDYVSTNTFLNIGKTFIMTLLIQLFSLVMSFFSYLLYGLPNSNAVLFATITGTIFSFGFLGMLIWEMFRLFRIVRNNMIRKQ